MTHDERDLMPLDPERDPRQWERLVGSIMMAATPELQRRSMAVSPILLLTEWMRPTLTSAATIGMLAAAVVLFVGGSPPAQSADVRLVAEGIGLPSAIATWLDTGSSDALDELVLAIEGESP